ncbi:sensor histidine kinase [Campylobacterota bacterium]
MILRFKDIFYNFINSGWEFNEDEKLEQLRFQILNISVLFASLGVPIGMAYNYIGDNFTLIYIEIFIMVFLVYILLALRQKRSDYERTTTFLTILILLFFDALILFSRPEEMKYTWILVYTAVFIFYKGSSKGWRWVALLCVSIIIIKLQSYLPIAFSWAQITYFLLIMFVLTALISFFQHTIEQNYKTILEQKQALKKFNLKLEETIEEKIHEYREKDEILFQQSKMAAMGEMIGNIAHQWRQPLNTISVVAGGMKMQKELNSLDDKTFDHDLETIHNTVQFLSRTINDFKDYFSPNKHPEDFDIKTSIMNDVRLIEPSYNALGIQVYFTLESCHLHSYKNELSQVILNILNNAKDALQSSSIHDKYIFITSSRTADCLTLSIKDNAGGIDEAIIPKIFEPYFTTKHKSQGTGIGLFMTQEIIVKHLNGNIKVSNVEYSYNDRTYKGAQFDIALNLQVKEDTISNAN